jgi:hypothetical protein
MDRRQAMGWALRVLEIKPDKIKKRVRILAELVGPRELEDGDQTVNYFKVSVAGNGLTIKKDRSDFGSFLDPWDDALVTPIPYKKSRNGGKH